MKRVPRVGKDIVTPDGVGVITEINAIREKVKVRIRTGEDDSFEIREYSMDDVLKPAVREAPKPQEKRPQGKKIPIPTEEEAAEAENAEENKKKRYPHQKAPKNLSTDQFLEKMHVSSEESGEKAENGEAKEHKRSRRRGGRGRHRGEGGNKPDGEGQKAEGGSKGDGNGQKAPSEQKKHAPKAEKPAPQKPE